MRIAFVHDWEPDFQQEMTWHDGLAAALRILSQRHELRFYTMGAEGDDWHHDYFDIHVTQTPFLVEDIRQFKPDVILHWADCTRPNAGPLATLGIPMALCFAGGDPMGPTNQYFDHFFVESAVYKERFEAAGCSVSTAFGTNTELFQPVPGMVKQFDTIFPATYCEWKRHYLYREATKGLRNVTAGFMYPDHERDIWEECITDGILTLPHVSAETLRFLYAASRVCVIPSKASGGSQRTVLEAMAMNVPLVLTEDGKGVEYMREAKEMGFAVGELSSSDPHEIRERIDDLLRPAANGASYRSHGRAYVMSKWTETHYADALEAGLQSLL